MTEEEWGEGPGTSQLVIEVEWGAGLRWREGAGPSQLVIEEEWGVGPSQLVIEVEWGAGLSQLVIEEEWGAGPRWREGAGPGRRRTPVWSVCEADQRATTTDRRCKNHHNRRLLP